MGIIELIKNSFRKKALSRNRSGVPTSMLPLREVRTAAVVIDAEDTSFDACKQAVQAFCRENGIKAEIFFFDFSRVGSSDRLMTSVTNTILAKDLNWYGKPSPEKMKLLADCAPDMFVSLVDNAAFPIHFMAACCPARFKVGRKQLPGNVFDMVAADSPERTSSEEEIFGHIKRIIQTIE